MNIIRFGTEINDYLFPSPVWNIVHVVNCDNDINLHNKWGMPYAFFLINCNYCYAWMMQKNKLRLEGNDPWNEDRFQLRNKRACELVWLVERTQNCIHNSYTYIIAYIFFRFLFSFLLRHEKWIRSRVTPSSFPSKCAHGINIAGVNSISHLVQNRFT